MDAEAAYLFRHALLRDAAYQLQLPGERAVMHRLALEIIEDLHGGRPAPPRRTLTRVVIFTTRHLRWTRSRRT